MALGNNNYNRNNQGGSNRNDYSPTYYSRLRIKNPNEHLVLTFSFWRATLKIIISENDNNGNLNELAFITMSPTKAHIMAEAVTRIIESDDDQVFGVDTGIGETHGFIAIGRDKGNPYLFIAKVNGNGSYESSQRFDFNMNYNYLLTVHNIEKLECQKEYMNNVELMMFHNVLEDFARSVSGAIGAAIYDIGRYEAAKLSNMIRGIADATGARIGNSGGNNNSGNGGGNSFFSNSGNNNNSGYSKPTKQPYNGGNKNYSRIDDLESALDE